MSPTSANWRARESAPVAPTDTGQPWTSLATLHIIGNVDHLFPGFGANNFTDRLSSDLRTVSGEWIRRMVAFSYALFDGASQWQA